jgi:co-chaperonin GroES (HSP10)
LATKKKRQEMRRFKFSPPDGHVQVAYQDPTETTSKSGLILPPERMKKLPEGTVTAIGQGVDGIVEGDKIWFERARATQVGDGIFDVPTEFIWGKAENQ